MLLSEYMKSDLWFEKRRRRLDIDNHQCRLCGSTDRLEVHHKCDGKPGGYDSYRMIPNESVEDDLTTLCHDHHEVITNAIRGDRYASKAPLQTEAHKPQLEERISHENKSQELTVSAHRGRPDFVPQPTAS